MRIFIGRSGSGKTQSILRTIAAKAEQQNGKQILLVPELYSHTYERRLAQETNNHAGRTAEVISFTRLTGRVFAEMGGLADQSLTSAGRLLTITQAAHKVDAGLGLYRGLYNKPTLLREILDLIDECKTCCIGAEDTFRVVPTLEQSSPALAEKMKELSQVYAAYESLCENTLSDPRDSLTRMAQQLANCTLYDQAELYIDAFQSFTPQEYLVIEAFLQRNVPITVALTFDKQNQEIFVATEHTLRILRRMAKRHGKTAEIIDFGLCKIQKPHDLQVLEQSALLPGGMMQPSDGQSVHIYHGANPVAECEYAMAYIRRTIQQTGAMWRDFAIVSRNGEDYFSILRMVAARYDVPIFHSGKTDLLSRPPLVLLTSALRVITGGWRLEDIFCCLKTGLCKLQLDQIDQLENYALCWRMRGTMWTKPLEKHPDGYGKTMDEAAQEKLAQLEHLRQLVAEPFLFLENAFRQAQVTQDFVQSLYDFLVMMQTPERMQERAQAYEQDGELQLADEYRQLWEIILQAMEQLVWICGQSEMTASHFAELFSLVLSEYDVGSIPVSLNRVNCGSIDRVCGAQFYPHLIVLGVNDGLLPRAPTSDGILNDHERMLLEAEGCSLGSGATERMLMEQDILYRMVSCPTKTLLLCCHLTRQNGQEARPSYFLGAISNKLSGVPTEQGESALESARLCAERPAFELACSALSGAHSPAAEAAFSYFSNDDRMKAVERGRKPHRKLELPDTIRELYGNTPHLSASRVDLFHACRFAFFMRHGLKAKPRKKAEFSAIESGTFIHYVLENTLSDLGKLEGGARKASKQQVQTVMQRWIAQYVKDFLGGTLQNQTARFRYLFRRLVRHMEQILSHVLEELQVSDFAPVDYELTFGMGGDLPPIYCEDGQTRVMLSGTADRVDGYIQNGRLYVRVMDYKSGTKSFSLSDVWNGLNLQMLLYLFAIEKNGLTHYQQKLSPDIHEICAAGVLYVPARDDILDLDQDEPDEEKLRALRNKLRKRSGLVRDDLDLLEAMEHGLQDGSRFLPVKLKVPKPTKKNPEPTPELAAASAVASLEQFGRLARFTQSKLIQMAKELKTGNIPAAPCRHGQILHCDWCEYRSACRFDEQLGDRVRALTHMTDTQFWEKLEEET